MSNDQWAALGCGLFFLACMAWVLFEVHTAASDDDD